MPLTAVEHQVPLTTSELLERLRRLTISPFAFRNFFSVDSNIARRLDADADLSAIHRHDSDFNVVADSQGFAGSSGEYQHKFRFTVRGSLNCSVAETSAM